MGSIIMNTAIIYFCASLSASGGSWYGDTDMRILQIVADGSPGGGASHVLDILGGLSNVYSLGLVTQANSYLLTKASSLGVECFGIDFFRSRLDARVPVNLREVVRKFRPQLLHIHGGRAGFFYTLAATK